MQVGNGAGKEKFVYVGQWPTKAERQAELDVDGGSKNEYEDMQLI